MRTAKAPRPPVTQGSVAPARETVVSREPIHEQILPHIREGIITGRWAPGQRLPEPELCREFGVSRTPLRDALRLLEAEGLVHLEPHVGAVVTDGTGPEVLEKLELLVALEAFAARKVARLRDAATLDEIGRLHEQMAAAARRGDARRYYRLNDAFHRAIVLGARNASLALSHEQVMWHVHRARHLANSHEPIDEVAITHHQAIVDGMLAGNGDRAAQAMRRHLDEVAAAISQQFPSD